MSKKRIELGRSGENIAASYLENNGYIIVERNYRHKSGEIDIIARDVDTLVFVEVKTRSAESFGHPLEAVGDRKQQQIRFGALTYLSRNDLMETVCRFDVIALLGVGESLEISHVTGAFEAGPDW